MSETKRSRRGGSRSKAKGSSFERLVCKKLSLWVTHGERDDCFWRSAMSGGRATVSRKKGGDVRQAGDITAVAEEGLPLTDRAYIECKAYRDLMVAQFLLGRGTLFKFWRHTCKEAKHYRKVPVLIVKQNTYETLVITNALLPLKGAVPALAHVNLRGIPCAVYTFAAFLKKDPWWLKD